MSAKKIVKLWKIGCVSYIRGLKVQEAVANLHKNPEINIANTLLCLEHTPVYTVGIRGDQYSVEEERVLREKGADFHRTNRGGLITFHGPGQLVVYPILNLNDFKPSMRWYVCQIEKTIIDLCEKFGLKAKTSPHTGVWVNDNKICAIGIHGSRFITTHGLALNCNADLTWFTHIVPCGIVGKGVTSLSKELNKSVSVEDTLPRFLESFTRTFDCELVNIKDSEIHNILNEINDKDEDEKSRSLLPC